MLTTAFLDVRLLPWRPRRRVMDPDVLRDHGPVDLVSMAESPTGFVVGLVLTIAVWLLIVVAAPVLVLVIAALFLPVELVVVAAVAVVLVAVRLLGVIPWVVVVLDVVTGEETVTRHRSLLRAVRRVREVNSDRRARVRWSLA